MSHLDRRLAGVHRRLVLRRALEAATELILVGLPVIMTLACVDFMLRPPSAGRLMELLLVILGLATIMARHLPAIARLRRGPETAAVQVERFDPSLGGRLLSYVDFRSRTWLLSGPHGTASADLIEAMCRQIEQRTENLDLERVVPLHSLRARMGFAGMVLALVCVLLASRPETAFTWATRVLHPFSEIAWPPRTRIIGLETAYRARRGDTLQISGQITGRIPADCEVQTWPLVPGASDNRPASSTDRFSITPDGRFSATVGPIVQPTAIRVRAGDADTSTIAVDAVDPPCIADLAIVCRYPEYLHRPNEQMASRDLRVPVGTRVGLNVKADKPVRNMTLILAKDGAETRESFKLLSATQGAASFTVGSTGWYAIRLEDATGMTEDKPPTYAITAIENRHPSVSLKYPETGMSVTPAAILPLVFEASDDFGIVAASVVWQIKQPGSAIAPPVSHTVIPLEAPARVLNSRFAWQLTDTQARPGDEILFYIEVEDAGAHISPVTAGTAKSETKVLSVVEPAACRAKHLARLNAALGDINRLSARVSAGWDEVSAIAHLLRQQEASCSSEVLVRLTAELDRQRSLAAQADAIARRVEHLADEWSINMPGQAALPEGSKLLAQAMAHLAAGPMSEAPTGLATAITHCEKDGNARGAFARLAKVQDAQAEALRVLAKISSALAGPGAKPPGARTGRPTSAPTENDFEQAQKALAANLKASLASTQLANAQPKTGSTAAGKSPNKRDATVSGPRGQGGARNARETTIVGGPAAVNPPAPTTTSEAIPPWQWNLPARARAVLQQATAEPFPPRQSAAIKRYYERLGQELGNRQ